MTLEEAQKEVRQMDKDIRCPLLQRIDKYGRTD